MKNSKTLFTLVVSLLLAATSFAQESPSKQINQIKRSPMYLYAEATMESAEEALSVARELLMQQVQEYVSTKPGLSQAKDVLVKNVNAKSESLSMMRGTMFRVFVYVRKTDIEAVDNATALNTGTQAAEVMVEQPVPPVPAPERPAERPVAETTPEPETPAEEVATQVVPEATAVASADLPAWQLQAINDLLNCSNSADVKAKLNRMKAEYKIKKYGTPDKCPNAKESFWVIFDQNGSVNTILGTGDNERINFRNMQYSTLDQFKGQEALWFNFAK